MSPATATPAATHASTISTRSRGHRRHASKHNARTPNHATTTGNAHQSTPAAYHAPRS